MDFLLGLMVVVFIFSASGSKDSTPSYLQKKLDPYLSQIQLSQIPQADFQLSYTQVEKFVKTYKPNFQDNDLKVLYDITVSTAKERNMDPRLALALMARESAFDPQAVSSAGAIGLGQIKPINYAAVGIDNPKDIAQNARGTILYLSDQLRRWNGYPNQTELGLASYKEGYGAVSRAGGTYKPDTTQYIKDIFRLRDSI